MTVNLIHTGLKKCFDQYGLQIPCNSSGQDAEYKIGQIRPEPGFTDLGQDLVRDELTKLVWPAKVNFFDFPLTWNEALQEVRKLNVQEFAGCKDWRLPNRRELRSILSHGQKKPVLPEKHPFRDVFLSWYWTSTTAAIAPAYAWYVHLEGARMFYGGKKQRYLAWPVRGDALHIPRTGQIKCFDELGQETDCTGSGQDAEISSGSAWPDPRFFRLEAGIWDRLTDLVWQEPLKYYDQPVNWQQALELVQNIKDGNHWRLPNINELESLVDASAHCPALPENHPFNGLQDGYWSSSTSCFETDWAYVLYLDKGAVGVGFKAYRDFFVWPVRSLDPRKQV